MIQEISVNTIIILSFVHIRIVKMTITSQMCQNTETTSNKNGTHIFTSHALTPILSVLY